MDSLLGIALKKFAYIPDKRSSNISHDLPDVLASALAMLSLKSPSLLQFETQTKTAQENLLKLFSIKTLCSDTSMRKILDKVESKNLLPIFVAYKNLLADIGIWQEYKYLNAFQIVAVDGVEHFCSNSVHCSHCLTKNHKNGTTTFHHQMLAATLVFPGKKEVFPLYCEPIINTDGNQKNDCELNAAKRLFDWFENNYKNENLLFVEDALSANAPHINRIKSLGYNFIINVKPDSHTYLFNALKNRTEHNLVQTHAIKRNDTELTFRWIPNISLNASNPDCLVNFLCIQERNLKNNSAKTFSWVTSIQLNKKNVEDISKAGRARWKIENETFNTLKNQGYYFEHNFGHGENYLATNLAFLMMIAFLIDQILQKCNLTFQAIHKVTKTKVKIWNTLIAFFTVMLLDSFEQLYIKIALSFGVQLE